jgi:hypothetical protein
MVCVRSRSSIKGSTNDERTKKSARKHPEVSTSFIFVRSSGSHRGCVRWTTESADAIALHPGRDDYFLCRCLLRSLRCLCLRIFFRRFLITLPTRAPFSERVPTRNSIDVRPSPGSARMTRAAVTRPDPARPASRMLGATLPERTRCATRHPTPDVFGPRSVGVEPLKSSRGLSFGSARRADRPAIPRGR